MNRANRFIEDSIYTLKRNFGQPVDLYIRGTATQDAETGDVTFTETKWKIKKAPVLTADLLRKFQYDLSFIAANKNFTYGGFYDKTQRGIIVDARDLPTDYAQSLDDSFIVDHRRYAIKNIEQFEQGRSFIFIVEELKGQRVNETFDTIDHLAPVEELESTVLDYWEQGVSSETLTLVETVETSV